MPEGGVHRLAVLDLSTQNSASETRKKYGWMEVYRGEKTVISNTDIQGCLCCAQCIDPNIIM